MQGRLGALSVTGVLDDAVDGASSARLRAALRTAGPCGRPAPAMRVWEGGMEGAGHRFAINS